MRESPIKSRVLVTICVCVAVWTIGSFTVSTKSGLSVKNDTLEFNQEDDVRLALKYLSPPSVLPYSLASSSKDPSRGQGRYVRKLLKEMRKGFFVEAGAYDGETYSNTLYLEKNLNWNGLLIEGDPHSYSQLVSKHRKSWISPACLATQAKPHRVNYTTYNHDSGHAMAGGVSNDHNNTLTPVFKRKIVEVQCIPLHVFLKAIGVTTVDYLSLDVEGSELKVLNTIPFDKLLIKAISIEYYFVHGTNTGTNGVQSLLDFFSDKDYQLVGISPSYISDDKDVVFVHKSILIN